MDLAPILLFVYARPEHTRRVLDSLAANVLAARSTLYVFSDGARTAADVEQVERVRRMVGSARGFARVAVTERAENYGLARNIMEGVTEVVERHGRVIVLEDDLVVAPHFLEFMNDALEVYADVEGVGHVQACDFTHDASLPDTFLIRWTGSWGWGTWARAWRLFQPDGRLLLAEIERRGLQRYFDFDGRYGYTRMLRRQTRGKNDSWAIRWNASLFLSGVLSLNVGRSLVANEGFDGSGTNCGGGGLFGSDLCMERIVVERIDPVVENMEARGAYVRYYARTNSFWAKVRRRLLRTLKGDFGR